MRSLHEKSGIICDPAGSARQAPPWVRSSFFLRKTCGSGRSLLIWAMANSRLLCIQPKRPSGVRTMPLDAPDLGHLADGKLQRCVRIHLPARPHDLCSQHLARDLFAMAEKGHRAAPRRRHDSRSRAGPDRPCARTECHQAPRSRSPRPETGSGSTRRSWRCRDPQPFRASGLRPPCGRQGRKAPAAFRRQDSARPDPRSGWSVLPAWRGPS